MTKILKATHEGKLEIGEMKIPCAVLADGTRLLTQGGFLKAIGRSRTPKAGTGSSVAEIPFFLSANNLKPFISKDLLLSTVPVRFITAGGREAWGYNADLLPKVCVVYLSANDEGNVIKSNQENIVRHCEILIRGLAHVGIIALVDEATGYQEVRRKDELNQILKMYISPELLPWAQKFPEEYFMEIFRLKGWPYEPGSVKRPGVIGSWTNKYVYDQLPKGVLAELKKKTPRDAKGRRKHRYHQLLTLDIGNIHLEKQLVAVMTLFRAASNWRVFEGLAARAFGKQKRIDFDEDDKEE